MKCPTDKTSIALLVLAVIAIAAAALVYLWGMGQPDREEHLSPTGTFMAFVKAFNARDVGAVYACFSSEMRAQYPKVEVEGWLDLVQTIGLKVTGWKVLDENVADDVAALRVQVTLIPSIDSGVENDRIPMVWERGKWLIDEWVETWGEDYGES